MKKSTLQKTNHLNIPSREEQHRTYSGLLTIQDFNTCGCAPYSHIKKTISALCFHTSAKNNSYPDNFISMKNK